jgi:hypothetical protein
LHIEGPASAHTALQIETTTSGFDPTIHFVSPANNSGIYVDDNDTNKMKFYNGYGKGAAGKEITFDNNGNVGIGTTNPAEKLNIDSGSLRIDATYGVGAPGFQVMKIVDKNNPTYGWVTNLETSLTGDLHLGRLVNGTRSDVMVFSRANGDVSFNGGVVKGARQTINHQGTTNEVAVSGNTYNTTMTSLNVTTTGNSKLLIWAHSGQILKPYDNANPQMRIEVNGTFIGSAHDGNHYWYATAGANSTSARVWLTNFGASGTLSAGTHTIRLVAGAYGAGHTFNYQNQNCHMVIMEVGA